MTRNLLQDLGCWQSTSQAINSLIPIEALVSINSMAPLNNSSQRNSAK